MDSIDDDDLQSNYHRRLSITVNNDNKAYNESLKVREILLQTDITTLDSIQLSIVQEQLLDTMKSLPELNLDFLNNNYNYNNIYDNGDCIDNVVSTKPLSCENIQLLCHCISSPSFCCSSLKLKSK